MCLRVCVGEEGTAQQHGQTRESLITKHILSFLFTDMSHYLALTVYRLVLCMYIPFTCHLLPICSRISAFSSSPDSSLSQCSSQNPELKDLLSYGFGIHHAGMNRVDRDTG